MNVPLWVKKELEMINPMYFAVFNPCIQDRKNMSCGKARWQLKKWNGVFPKNIRLWDTDECELIITICKESVTENGLVDAGYEEVDMRAIDAIRESHWWKLDWKRKIAELDWRNERKERFAESELNYQSKYVAKRIWRSRHEPTVHLSGKKWKI